MKTETSNAQHWRKSGYSGCGANCGEAAEGVSARVPFIKELNVVCVICL